MIVVTPTDPIPCGEPTAYPVADLDMDGQVTSADLTAWTDLKAGGSSASAYGLDLDFDDYYGPGEADEDLFWESYDANLGLSGKGRVSTLGVASRVGYAGYQWDQVARAYHVRYRVYLPEIGRWTRRDPLGYVDGKNLYEYCAAGCVAYLDSLGQTHQHAQVVPSAPPAPGSLQPGRIQPSPVRPGPLWPDTPARIPWRIRTPIVLTPAGQCVIVACVFYCIGEQIGEAIPVPTNTPQSQPVRRFKSDDQECQDALAKEKQACNSSPVPMPPQGKRGTKARDIWCQQMRRERDRYQNCRNALYEVNQKCRDGDWTVDDSGYQHFKEFEDWGTGLTRLNRVIEKECPPGKTGRDWWY
jgi:RHS repeat-associated protein